MKKNLLSHKASVSLFATRLQRFLPALVLSALLVLVLTKCIYVGSIMYFESSIKFVGGLLVLSNDAVVIAAITGLLYVSYHARTNRAVSVVTRLLSFLLQALYAIDLYVLINFSAHVLYTDLIKYWNDALTHVSQAHPSVIFIEVIVGSAIIGSLLAALINYHQECPRRSHRALGGVTVLFAVLACANIGIKPDFAHSWMYKNIVAYNQVVLSESKQYSAPFIDTLCCDEVMVQQSAAPRTPNIILLMVESLSSYQSAYFSGINDWTPCVDRIARENVSFPNFYANGFTTEDAEIALLTGQLPLYRPSSYTIGGGTSFEGFFAPSESLPSVLKEAGYATAFMTAVSLDFSDTGAWAESLGFDEVEGEEHAFYDDWARYHFKSAPDEALYLRMAEKIGEFGDQRYFIFAKTASSHHPFINPETEKVSVPGAFKYADKQIGAFYDHLKQTGFFDDGILIILGDHHAMIPVTKPELELYGPLRARAKVPLIIVSENQCYQDTRNYQQIDVYHTLKGLVTGTSAQSDWVGNLLLKTGPRYIASRRGDLRNMISLICDERDLLIELNGDDTKIESGEPIDAAEQKRILNKINSTRVLHLHDK